MCLDFKSQLRVRFFAHSLFNYYFLLFCILLYYVLFLFIFHFLSPLSSFFSFTYLPHPLSLSPPIPLHTPTSPHAPLTFLLSFFYCLFILVLFFLPTFLSPLPIWALNFFPPFLDFPPHFPRWAGPIFFPSILSIFPLLP